MIEQLKSVMVGTGATWVLWLMFALSILSIAVMLERAWLFWSIRDDLETLMRELRALLRKGDLEGAHQRLQTSRSAEAAVVAAGLKEADLGVKAVEEAMAAASALQRLRLERRLAYLGTLGNNAPFIGLLGTVIGIVGAFEELGKANMAPLNPSSATASQLAPTAVMTSIAEALVATAVGLLVAIPAVAAFNTFQRIVKTRLANTDALGHVLLAHLKGDKLPLSSLASSEAQATTNDPASMQPSTHEEDPTSKPNQVNEGE